MKKLMTTAALFIAATFTQSGLAGTSCNIMVGYSKPCKHRIKPNSLFRDGDGLAQMSPKRCAQRALEYYRYCGYGPYKNWVGAYFMKDGQHHTAVTTNGVTSDVHVINRVGAFEKIGSIKVSK